MTIKEYAEKRRICVSPIYRKIQRHNEELKGHVKKIRGRIELDEDAVMILDGEYPYESSGKKNYDFEIRELQEEIRFLKKELKKKDKELEKVRQKRDFYQIVGEQTKRELMAELEKLTESNENLKNELEQRNRSFFRKGGTRK